MRKSHFYNKIIMFDVKIGKVLNACLCVHFNVAVYTFKYYEDKWYVQKVKKKVKIIY